MIIQIISGLIHYILISYFVIWQGRKESWFIPTKLATNLSASFTDSSSNKEVCLWVALLDAYELTEMFSFSQVFCNTIYLDFQTAKSCSDSNFVSSSFYAFYHIFCKDSMLTMTIKPSQLCYISSGNSRECFLFSLSHLWLNGASFF